MRQANGRKRNASKQTSWHCVHCGTERSSKYALKVHKEYCAALNEALNRGERQ